MHIFLQYIHVITCTYCIITYPFYYNQIKIFLRNRNLWINWKRYKYARNSKVLALKTIFYFRSKIKCYIEPPVDVWTAGIIKILVDTLQIKYYLLWIYKSLSIDEIVNFSSVMSILTNIISHEWRKKKWLSNKPCMI